MIRIVEVSDWARTLVDEKYKDYFDEHGIEMKTNSTGFSEKEQKWYGWSHRAIYGFGIGHVCKEGDCGVGEGLGGGSLEPGFECKTLDDYKKVATEFAKSVD